LAAMCGTVGAACGTADLLWAGPWWGCHGPAVFLGGRGAGEGRTAMGSRPAIKSPGYGTAPDESGLGRATFPKAGTSDLKGIPALSGRVSGVGDTL